MIIRTEIDGRPASIQYLTMDREPTTEEDAEMVYIAFDDGETMWAYPAGEDEEDEEIDEDDELVDEEPEEDEELEPEDVPEDLAAQSEPTTDSASRRQPKIKFTVHQK